VEFRENPVKELVIQWGKQVLVKAADGGVYIGVVVLCGDGRAVSPGENVVDGAQGHLYIVGQGSVPVPENGGQCHGKQPLSQKEISAFMIEDFRSESKTQET